MNAVVSGDECRCHCRHKPSCAQLASRPSTQRIWVGTCDLSLHQWGDAMSPISTEEPVMFFFIPPGLTHKHQGKTKIHLKSEPNWLDLTFS